MKRTLSAIIVWAGLASSGDASDLVALCIGNDAYVDPALAPDNSVADAALMRDTLIPSEDYLGASAVGSREPR